MVMWLETTNLKHHNESISTLVVITWSWLRQLVQCALTCPRYSGPDQPPTIGDSARQMVLHGFVPVPPVNQPNHRAPNVLSQG